MDYINSHTTSLSTDLKLDPESRSRTVRPIGGGVGERGGTCGLYCITLILPHSQLTLNLILSPEPLQRTSSCAEIKQKKCLNNRISKDPVNSAIYNPTTDQTTFNAGVYNATIPSVGDSIYVHPFDWESSGTEIYGHIKTV